MDILKKIVEGKPLTIVACLDVFMEKMIPFEEFKEHCLTIDFESIIDTDALKLKLSELGYENSGLVEAQGSSVSEGESLTFPVDGGTSGSN